jgi:hypothetical protein
MNAFERHGLGHLSASSLNTWAAEPALWVMEKLLGKRAPAGAAAARGTAAEAGVAHGLFQPDAEIAECQAVALASFDRAAAFLTDASREKEREAIPGMVEVALRELRQYGRPTPVGIMGGQHKVEVRIADVPVPIIGYQDFLFADHGIVVDLKTQLALTSKISPAHARQGAVYIAGTNREMRFCYTTPKKCAVYRLEDAPAHLDVLRAIAHRLERFLAVSADPHELAGIVCPNYEAFYWNSTAARSMGREVFGF